MDEHDDSRASTRDRAGDGRKEDLGVPGAVTGRAEGGRRSRPAPLPADETERLAALRGYAVLDTPPEEAFDRVVQLVAAILDVPIALVSLVDEHRQWFKAKVGLDASETPREQSFCAHAILSDEILQVPDATEDPRFADNPLVTARPGGIRFYAGAPLEVPGGHRLGTLCAIDTRPRELDERQRQVLRDLAALAADQLELRRAGREAEEARRRRRRPGGRPRRPGARRRRPGGRPRRRPGPRPSSWRR
jgi:GAF domain-containing protein